MQAFISHLIPALCVYAAYSYDFSGCISYYITYCIMHIVMLKVYVVKCKRFILGLSVDLDMGYKNRHLEHRD